MEEKTRKFEGLDFLKSAKDVSLGAIIVCTGLSLGAAFSTNEKVFAVCIGLIILIAGAILSNFVIMLDSANKMLVDMNAELAEDLKNQVFISNLNLLPSVVCAFQARGINESTAYACSEILARCDFSQVLASGHKSPEDDDEFNELIKGISSGSIELEEPEMTITQPKPGKDTKLSAKDLIVIDKTLKFTKKH